MGGAMEEEQWRSCGGAVEKLWRSCGNLRLNVTMRIEEFKENYHLLNDIVRTHKRKYIPDQKFQTLLMPFFCFKIPFKILSDIGYFDESFVDGGEDIDYRIRCAIKGDDVNFLIDSYLLHFHGKSTWDGNETPNQTKQRNEAYTKAFLKKWKQELTQIFIMRKDFLDVLQFVSSDILDINIQQTS